MYQLVDTLIPETCFEQTLYTFLNQGVLFSILVPQESDSGYLVLKVALQISVDKFHTFILNHTAKEIYQL